MAADDLWGRLMTDIQGLIQNLDLSSPIPTAVNDVQSVLVQGVEDQLNVSAFPVVIVTNQGLKEAEDEEHSTFEEDFVIYPVGVLVVDGGRGDFQDAQKAYRTWRRRIQTALRGLVDPAPGLTSNCPEFWMTRLIDEEVVPPKVMELNLPTCGFVVLCHCNESRVRSYGRGIWI